MFILFRQLIRFKFQGGEQGGDIGIMSGQEGKFRFTARRSGGKVLINIVQQRMCHVFRDNTRGKQRFLIAVFQGTQRSPLLRSGDFAPGDPVCRETFIILQVDGIHRRVCHFQRAFHARLFAGFNNKAVFAVGQ